MGGLFGGAKSSGSTAAPQVVYMPQYIEAPTDDTAEVKAAEEQQRKAAKLAKGRQSTILTSGLGVEDTTTVGRRSLLGE